MFVADCVIMMTDKVKEVENILYLFSNYWRNDPQNLLEKLTPQQAAHQLNQMLIEAKARHLSDISRAIGILDGLGFSDEYLNNQRAKLMKELKAEKDK